MSADPYFPDSVTQLDRQFKKTLGRCCKPRLGPSDFDKASKAADRIAWELRPLGLEQAAKCITQYFLNLERNKELGRPAGFPVECFLEFGSKGFEQTLQFGVRNATPEFSNLQSAKLLAEIESPVLLSKLAKKRPTLLKESIFTLRECVGGKAPLPKGMLWVVQNAKLTDLIPIAEALFRAPEKSLGGRLLERDKSGKALASLLGAVALGNVSVSEIAQALADHPKAARNFLGALPKILPTTKGKVALEILSTWIEAIEGIPDAERAMISGALSTCCGALLLKVKKKPIEHEALEVIGKRMKELATQINSDSSGFWAMHPIEGSSDHLAVRRSISRDAAILLVEAIEKLEDARYAPLEVFTALAINFGMEPIHATGDQIYFDFNAHKDAEGGLIPGNMAQVVSPGWRHNDFIVKKAQVKPIHSNA
jgi:hypothetical protein